ncbi:MotA/TolQ/ExbB proton channel family protein [Rhodoferax sp. 4810]|uniref:MotA/TolQ/ExbB proton channel family protein n=1 Tax=Thiospirillum jenense TaxID=1653858 RepID=A0A839HC32_9GAMM|nr:MotA/TolQ/ExbB proton channel family protein [Thiospirillum jenense]MBB1075873.1 MotA/TolQ/ExbB proton channel family protein [Rhodoferax jenense]MBB1126104.1 MotA/TolQ/ExbB proton channel family protein [Thiospirillum jenense]
MNWTYWQQLAAHSGGVLYVMAGLFTVALTIGIERTWVLRSVTRHGAGILNAVAALAAQDHAALAALRDTQARSLHGLLLTAALDTAAPSLAQRLDELIMRHVPLLDRHLWLLDTTVTLAPLLGLLGTIVGMFHAFQVLAAPGTAPHAVTSGVAEALIATAAGLLIAVIGLLFFNGLNERVRLAVHQLDTLKVMLVNRFAADGEVR